MGRALPKVEKIREDIGEQISHTPPLIPTDPNPLFSKFGDTNSQHPEVPWPDSPAPED